jgi:hypothetical protein
MNDEDRLAGLEPVRPRIGLRDEVLGRVGAELAGGTVRRRLFWAAAAALLVVIQITLALMTSRHEENMRMLVGETPRVDRQETRDVDEAVLALADEPEMRRLVRRRIERRSTKRGLTTTAGKLGQWSVTAMGGGSDG